MDDSKSYCLFIIKVTISEKRKVAKLQNKGQNSIKRLTKEELTTKLQLGMRLVDLTYNFECDWLIELSDNNLASESVRNRSFLKQSQSTKL